MKIGSLFLSHWRAIALPAAVCAGFSCGGSDGGQIAGNAGSGAGATSTASAGAGGAGGGMLGGVGGVGGAASGTTTTSGSSTASGSSSSGVGAPPTEIAQCQGKTYACGDLADNDRDGLIDSQDPDCLGPCDDTEDSFFGGIPGQAGPGCIVDCYFDQDSGPGNDNCYWNHECDPHEVAPGYYPEPANGEQCAYDPDANTPGTGLGCAELSVEQSQACHDYCGPLTPNGCDCFGCCELPAGSHEFVWLGSQGADGSSVCTLQHLDDPALCHPCLPVPACLNDCGHCELCIGKDVLPPDCLPGGAGGAGGGSGAGSGAGGGSGGQQCPPGVQACGLEGQDPCGIDYFCLTGCCQKVPT